MHMLRMRQQIRLFEPGVADAFKHNVNVRELKQRRHRAGEAC